MANSAEVWDQACVSENAYLGGFSSLSDQVQLYGNAAVGGKDTWICGSVKIFDNAQIGGNSFGKIKISGNAQIYGNARIEAKCDINGNVEIQ